MSLEFHLASNIADQLKRHALHRPTKTAIIQGSEQLNYLELYQQVIERAKALIDLGVQEGDIVGVALSDCIDHIVMLFAVARAGAIILPMDCRWSATEKEALVGHFKPARVLIEEGDIWCPSNSLTVKSLRCDLGHEALCHYEFPKGQYGLTLSLSSGTTGRPKGPLVSHQQFINRFMTHWIDLGFGSRETYINATPLYFGGGRAFSLSSLFTGGTVVLFPPPYSPQELAQEIERTQSTLLFLVPTLLRRILSEILSEIDALHPQGSTPIKTSVFNAFLHLRTLISSGSALTSEERQAISQHICSQFIEYYSSTEGGGVSVLSPMDQARYPDSVGRPIFGVDVEIVNEEHQVLPPQTVGRIRYKGMAVADGFYKDPEASQESFLEGWFYPGDLGMLNEEGYLFLKGRFKDMIIRGGINIYPLEIENTLMSNPCVSEAAVVAMASKEFGEEVVAFVSLKTPISPSSLIEFCKTHLAPYKVPKLIRVMEQLPRNSGGKVIKSELAKLLPT
jgi:acyl-CoA synthetase (AMP-forming)/AMP-acid ligase II